MEETNIKEKSILWEGLDLELIHRIKELNLSSSWNMIAQSMVVNFLYSIRKLVEDAKKDELTGDSN